MTEAIDPLAAYDGGQRPQWSLFRSALEEVGFRPSKTLGQNFLIDPNAARAIAEDARLAPGEHVLEVGAGCGFLTLHLAELGLALLSVEIDSRLLAVARRLLAGRSNVRWLLADALAGKHELEPRLAAELPVEAPWHLVSNLPYSISAPLLVVLSRLPNPPRSMTVLIQDEVARRIVAGPGEPEWGPLSVRLGLLYRSRAGRMVGAQLFWPRPRVASRIVHLGLEPIAPLDSGTLRAFDRLVEGLFRGRRKQLLGGLAELLGDRGRALGLLEGARIDTRARAEVLTPGELLGLARALDVEPGAGANR